MARVAALLPDLLFGSKVQGMLAAAGHEVEVVGADATREQLAGADVLVLDLCEDAPRRLTLGALAGEGTATLAFYLHTDVDTKAVAVEAGIDLVVPRSRMAREGGALVERLLDRASASR